MNFRRQQCAHGRVSGFGFRVSGPEPRNPNPVRGFTLIEIMVALSLLGMSAMILLQAHYDAIQLFTNTREEVILQHLLERALGQAEMEVMGGKMEGSDKFGARYADYTFSYTAQPMGEETGVPLFTVTVNVNGPKETRSMSMLLYNIAQ